MAEPSVRFPTEADCLLQIPTELLGGRSDVLQMLLDTPDILLRAQAAQQLKPPRSWHDPSSPACPLFVLLRWHSERYPTFPPPSEMVLQQDDWLAVLMGRFLDARERWTDDDVTSLTGWWNKQRHEEQCSRCRACVPVEPS